VRSIKKYLLVSFGFVVLSAPTASADIYRIHAANLEAYQAAINAAEEEIKALLVRKHHTMDSKELQLLLADIVKKDAEVKKIYEDYRKERVHMKSRHPEEGDESERKYTQLKPRTIEQIATEIGIDGKLDKIKKKIRQKYGEVGLSEVEKKRLEREKIKAQEEDKPKVDPRRVILRK